MMPESRFSDEFCIILTADAGDADRDTSTHGGPAHCPDTLMNDPPASCLLIRLHRSREPSAGDLTCRKGVPPG